MSSSNPSSLAVENWLSLDDWPAEVIACNYNRSQYLTKTSNTVREVNIRIQFVSGTTIERCHELLEAIAPSLGPHVRSLNSIHTDAGFAVVPAISARFIDELD